MPIPRVADLIYSMVLLAGATLLAEDLSTEVPPDTSSDATGQRPPNFIVIFCDDMGYADIGPFGAKGYQTPHLDRMATEGMRFTDFYVGRSFCTPSRAALMTWCIPTRVGIAGNFGPSSTTGLNPAETTIAEILKQRRYATAIFGKWHLGHLPQFLPTKQGFDEYYGLPYSNVADAHPDVVARLKSYAEEMRKELGRGPQVGPERRPIGS